MAHLIFFLALCSIGPRAAGALLPFRPCTIAAATLLVAGCQPLPHPFADDVPRKGSPMLALRDSASVTIAPIEGGPKATAEKLGPAMASALQAKEIAASEKTASVNSYELLGRIQEMEPSEGKAALVAVWELRDPSGKWLGERAERIEATAGDWAEGNAEAVARLAQASASQLVAMLQDEAPSEAEIGGRVRLLIGDVKGAPGDGGAALTRTVAELLRKQDLAIVSDPNGAADFILDAEVAVGRPRTGKENVKIVWHLRRKDGSEIGTVGQENDVPAGLLDGAWGDIAYTIAAAAQDGILELLSHSTPPPAAKPQP